jgi:hypothetical protein
MTHMVKYEAARKALAEAYRIDEVKDIRNKADAMQMYAKQAKDSELIELATDIKMRAERRAGELLREMKKNPGSRGTAQGSTDGSGGIKLKPPENNTPKLSDLNITKKESSLWQKLAKMPEDKFEEKLTGIKQIMRAKTDGTKRKKAKSKGNSYTPEQEATVIAAKLDGKTHEEAAALAELNSVQPVKTIMSKHEGRCEGRADPIITPDMLSKTAQQKLEAAARQQQKAYAAEFANKVNARVKEFLEDTILPIHRKEQERAKLILKSRNGIMDKDTFNSIRRALHPDSRNSISDKKLAEAFNKFEALEKLLLSEKDSPTPFQDLSISLDEMKRRATENRKARRAAKTTGREMAR